MSKFEKYLDEIHENLEKTVYKTVNMNENTVRKRMHLNELMAILIVKSRTNIKTPNILSVVPDKNDNYFVVMEKIKGIYMSLALTFMDNELIIKKLKENIMELRKIENTHENDICSIVNGNIFELGDPNPFKTQNDFVEYVNSYNDYDSYGVQIKNDNEKSVFTHSDLNPTNILVDENYNLYIIDWGLAGYFPKYWEKLKATYKFKKYLIWKDIMNKVFENV